MDRLEALHTRGFVHRDLKPENFIIGIGDNAKTIHIIDFGLAEHFSDIVTGMHRPYSEGHEMLGTARYSSTNTHNGIAQTRRDDLISLSYILLYFIRGSLPWQDLTVSNREPKYQQMANAKAKLKPYRLCQGLPTIFSTFITYAEQLDFEEVPNYAHLHSLINQHFVKDGHSVDVKFDWELHPDERGHRVYVLLL